MLVVSTKVDERVIIRDTETGETIAVMLVEILANRGPSSRVRLGFEASPRFEITREELDEAVCPRPPRSQPGGQAQVIP